MKRILFEKLRKIEMKMKSFFKPWKVSFIDADFRHYDLIFDFLVTHREPENYLIFLLKKLLSPANSQKIIYSNTIALAEAKIIGFDSRMFFPSHYYWGSAVTVHPRFRQLGVARHLIEIGENLASKMNINRVRHVNVFSNIPIFKKLGYREIRPWYILGCKLAKTKTADSKFSGIREAVDSDLEYLENFLFESDYFALTNQMYVEDLTWYPLDDRLWLGDLIKERRVLLNEEKGNIRGIVIINKKSLINPFPGNSFSIMEIGYFDGDWLAILNFIQGNYHPDFLRIYSADGIPLKYLPPGIKSGYFVRFNDLFGGLNRLELSDEKLYFTSVMLMQKIINAQ